MKKLIILFILAMISLNVLADENHEKIYLTQMLNQLNALKPLIFSAAHEQDKQARIEFHYTEYHDSNGIQHNGLLEDINNIEGGIRAKLNQQYHEPRYFPAIKGDYIETFHGNNHVK